MSSEGYNPYRPPIDTVMERLQDRFSDFEPAVRQAGMIPREGIHPETAINLSVAPCADIESFTDARIPESREESEKTMQLLWDNTIRRRVELYDKAIYGESARKGWLTPATYAPDTDTLFRESLAPAILKHAKETGRKKLLVPNIGYPLPFWFRDQLEGVEFVEGKPLPHDSIRLHSSQLEQYIMDAKKLPRDIGAVYLDYPSTTHSSYVGHELVAFIRNNPNVLFIIDQANLHFDSTAKYDLDKDMILAIPKFDSNYGDQTKATDCLVLVTNSTSKAFGTSGAATISATQRGRDVIKGTSEKLPQYIGFDDESLIKTNGVLRIEGSGAGSHERYQQSIRFREAISKTRRALWKSIKSSFGESALPYKFGEFAGPHFFVDAKALGFADGEALSDYLASEHSIGTKTAKWYGDIEKHPELLDYVYIGVPVKPEHLEVLQAALAAIKQRMIGHLSSSGEDPGIQVDTPIQ